MTDHLMIVGRNLQTAITLLLQVL